MSTPTTAARAQKKRRRNNIAESLPQYLPTATEFSDDPDLMDPVFVMQAIKDELGSGKGPLGDLWGEVQEATSLQRPGGRPRAKGDWALLYAAGYVLSQQAEMAAFWRSAGAEDLFLEAGFDAKLSYQSTYLRFVELEAEQCVEAFDAAADKLIQHARSKDPRIGREVFVDGASIHSRARLHHDCPDAAKCKAAGGNPRAILEIASAGEVKQARKEEAEQPADETTVHPAALKEAADQSGRYPHYVELKGHRYGILDRDAGARQYAAGGAGKGKFWVGGLDVMAVDGFTRGMLNNVVISAKKQEFKGYFALLRKLETTLDGDRPEIVSLDRGHSFNSVFERNTRRGIGSAIPFRKPHTTIDRQGLRSEQVDEHGYIRCQYCGGPCTQVGPRLGLRYTPAGNPRFVGRCISPNTPDCIIKTTTVDPAEVKYGWRLLLPIPRESERYHATRQRAKNFEATFRHVRQRYRAIGDDETGKLKRFGLQAHRLRLAAARFIEWFRICLRHGWLGNHAKQNNRQPLTATGDRRLRGMLLARRQRGLNLPYGPAAFSVRLASTPELPPKYEPPSKAKT